MERVLDLNYSVDMLSNVELTELFIGKKDLKKMGDKTIVDFLGYEKHTLEFIGFSKKTVAIITGIRELTKRRFNQFDKSMKRSSDLYNMFQFTSNDYVESFWVVAMNRSYKVIKTFKVSSGGQYSTIVDIKVIMLNLISLRATAFACIHNHPSGICKPSPGDISITQKIKDSSLVFDITFVDHIIVAGNEYYSFLDEGKL